MSRASRFPLLAFNGREGGARRETLTEELPADYYLLTTSYPSVCASGVNLSATWDKTDSIVALF